MRIKLLAFAIIALSSSIYGACKFTEGKESISNGQYLLQSHKKHLFIDDPRWNFAFKKYQRKAKSDNLKILPAPRSSGELEKWCFKNSWEKYHEHTYNLIEAWCTSPSINEIFTEIGVGIISDFSKKLQEYQTEQELTIPDENMKAEGMTAEKMKKWCESSSNMDFRGENDPTFLRVVKWCLDISNLVNSLNQ